MRKRLILTEDRRGDTGLVIEDGVLLYIRNNITALDIPEGVVEIDASVAENSDVQLVYFPSTLKIIGDRAFNRSKVIEAVFQDGLTSIGDHAFFADWDLKKVYLPDSVQSVGQYAFGSCKNLTEAHLPNTLKEIPNGLFHNCDSLREITIPDGTEAILENALTACNSLLRIELPASIKYLAYWSIAGNNKLHKIMYKGSMLQFNLINKVVDWNRGSGHFTVYCTDGTIEYHSGREKRP